MQKPVDWCKSVWLSRTPYLHAVGGGVMAGRRVHPLVAVDRAGADVGLLFGQDGEHFCGNLVGGLQHTVGGTFQRHPVVPVCEYLQFALATHVCHSLYGSCGWQW